MFAEVERRITLQSMPGVFINNSKRASADATTLLLQTNLEPDLMQARVWPVSVVVLDHSVLQESPALTVELALAGTEVEIKVNTMMKITLANLFIDKSYSVEVKMLER